MTIEETKELIADNKNHIATMQAYTDGKQIQYFDENTREWEDILAPSWLRGISYRVKPEPKYRPFKDADECWQEMLKHQPFGWVKTIANIPELHNISAIFPSAEFPVLLGIDLEEGEAREYSLKLSEMYDLYTFADGAPFGVKEGIWEN